LAGLVRKSRDCDLDGSDQAADLEREDEPIIGGWATAEGQEREQRKREEPQEVFDDGERNGFHVWPKVKVRTPQAVRSNNMLTVIARLPLQRLTEQLVRRVLCLFDRWIQPSTNPSRFANRGVKFNLITFHRTICSDVRGIFVVPGSWPRVSTRNPNGTLHAAAIEPLPALQYRTTGTTVCHER
jgi:hypothetical protein